VLQALALRPLLMMSRNISLPRHFRVNISTKKRDMMDLPDDVASRKLVLSRSEDLGYGNRKVGRASLQNELGIDSGLP